MDSPSLTQQQFQSNNHSLLNGKQNSNINAQITITNTNEQQKFSQKQKKNNAQKVKQNQTKNTQKSKFNSYLQKKVLTIQETKQNTIKIAEKYFQEIQQKIIKYLLKQKKKILISYEDNINHSLNCLNHNFLYTFNKGNSNNTNPDSCSNSNTKTSQKSTQNHTQQQNKQNKKHSQKPTLIHQTHPQIQNHNQLEIKLQIKKLLEQMYLSENHINQSIKLIGEGIKSQIHKLMNQLESIFQKIPTLTKLQENKNVVLIKNSPLKNQGKKNKNANRNSNKVSRKQSEIYSQTNNDSDLPEVQRSIKITQKLIRKLSVIHHQKVLTIKSLQNETLLKTCNNDKNGYLYHIIPKQIKQSHVASKIKQCLSSQSLCNIDSLVPNLKLSTSSRLQLDSFDTIHEKSLLHLYKVFLTQNKKGKKNDNPILQINQNQPQNQINIEQRLRILQEQNQQAQQKLLTYQILINDKVLDQWQRDQKNKLNLMNQKYEYSCKIEFDSKPNREYLLILSSCMETINERKYKTYKMSIYNYKGQLITQEHLGNVFKTYEQENIVKVFQIKQNPIFLRYVYLIFSNRVVRLSLKNLTDKKQRFYSLSQEKLVRCEAIGDKMVVFDGRKLSIQTLGSQLNILQTFSWTALFPAQMRLHMLMTVKLNTSNKAVTLIIPSQPIDDVLYYIDNGFLNKLNLQYKHIKANTYSRIQTVHSMIQIEDTTKKDHKKMYIVLSRQGGTTYMQKGKTKYDMFLVEFGTQIKQQKGDCQKQSENLNKEQFNRQQIQLKIQSQIQEQHKAQNKSNLYSQIKGTAYHINQIQLSLKKDEQILKVNYIKNKNQLIICLKNGKMTTYELII